MNRGGLFVYLHLFGVLLATTLPSADAANAPYFENFEDETLGAVNPSEPAPESGTFTITDNTGYATPWSVTNLPGGKYYRYGASVTATTNTNSSASIPFPDVPGNSFTISTDFLFRTLIGEGGDAASNFGFGILGSSAGFASGSYYELVYTPNAFAVPADPLGSLILREVGGDGQVNATAAINIPVNPTAPYSLMLNGVYQDGSLVLTGTLVTGTTTATVSATDSTPLNGPNFGYTMNHLRQGSASVNDNLSVNFDNFSVTAVPEPATLPLLAASLICFARRRPFRAHGRKS